jgi:unsaturated chondroitin disaccharide hydrolase
MYTGCFWLAYELTGEKEFKDIALSHILAYKSNIDKKENIDDHDVGFMYSPSCVAAYKLTGDERIKEIALRTAEYFYYK